ncbi:MAG: TIM barrel protein [Clostridiales bacterium]|mgnify:CR=1 FL=1|nr:TIM barrel protein [Clostridiales bacterium]
MKLTFNLTSCGEDADFLANPNERLRQLRGFDGVELQIIDEPKPGLFDSVSVIGLHMSCLPCWYSFWRGDEEALLKEFGNLDAIENYYGGSSREALLKRFRRDLRYAEKFHSEYIVFHVAESTIEESFTEDYARSDEEVCEASCEILNALFDNPEEFSPDYRPLLLLENLWQPGLTLLNPRASEYMLNGVNYSHKGIMLDTGHLMNTNCELESGDEALSYIYSVLEADPFVAENIRGIHINESLSGAYAKKIQASPPILKWNHAKRSSAMFMHVFKRDMHRPFTAKGVKRLVEDINPNYLTVELISSGLDDRRRLNDLQLKALGNL